MTQMILCRSSATRTAAAVLAAMLSVPTVAAAQSVTGRARAVQASVLGTTVLADTGLLSDSADARDATLQIGTIPSLLSGEVLHAVTVGWPDQVASEASVANVNMVIGATAVSASFVMARALAATSTGGNASALIDNLTVNGVSVAVTGAPNQRIPIAGGELLINEQTSSSSGTTVNALHARVLGVADVVLASATAGIQ